MLLWLYSWLMRLTQPLLRVKLRRRAEREPGYARNIPERFGNYATAPESAATPLSQRYIWVHAVSLGETRAAAVLIAALREQWPTMRLLLTHGTATGRAEGARLLREGDMQVWQPWDTPEAVQRFLSQFNPRVGILVETEIWPNMVALCHRAGVALVLVNARLSAASARRARWLAWLARPAYRSLSAVWAQSEDDAERLRALGAPVQAVLGNLKFDATPDSTQLALGQHWRQPVTQPVVMFASSRESEESLWLQVLRVHPQAKKWQWLLVPRHPQRFSAVAKLVRDAGLSLTRRSRWRESPAPAQVWLGDTLGEMALYYGLSDLALLGGSFEPLGGQNLIEAAACGCPVLMGPKRGNVLPHIRASAFGDKQTANLLNLCGGHIWYSRTPLPI